MTLNYVNQGVPTVPQGTYPMPIPGYGGQVSMPGTPIQQNYPGSYGMPYNPVYGGQPQYPQQTAPSYSAVKIDINGASVGTGQPSPAMPMYPGRTQMMPPPVSPYMMPPVSPYMMQQPPMPVPPPVINQPQQMQPMPVPPPYIVQQTPMPVPPPVINQPQQMQPIPLPPPVINQPQQMQAAQVPPPVTEQPQQMGQLDPAVQPLFQAIRIITPEQGENPSQEEQNQAMRVVAQYAQTFQAANDMIKADPNNQTALEAKNKVDTLVKPLLMDERTFKGLVSVATEDTSALSGQEKQQAEENKKISMWTLAILQKLFREEVNKELAKENIPSMSIGEVPGVSQIVDNIKSDPNPEIREAGIVALMEAAGASDPESIKALNPEDKKLLSTVLSMSAEQDSSQDVKNIANGALEELQA